MKKILGLTSIRSDYDLMSEVYKKLNGDPEVELKILATGAHLSPAFGLTIDLIKSDGLDILCEIETLISGDSKTSRLKTASGLLAAAIDIIRSYDPELILYAGDREDVLIAAMIGAFLGIPTVHFFGGDHASDGHVDNPVRHASSKLSTAHFVSVDEHKMRLLKMGENEERIFVVGSVALDKFVLESRIDRIPLLTEIGAKPHSFGNSLAILIFHPVEQEKELAPIFVRNAVTALIERGFHVLIGSPNSDPGNFKLVDEIKLLAARPEVTFYGNTSRVLFVNLMRNAALMVGNSSAGILEAATVKLPVINIGERQQGRLCGQNVIFTNGDYSSIVNALNFVTSQEFETRISTLSNPYGDGNSAARAVQILKSTNFKDIFKKTEDPLNVDFKT